MLYKYSIAIALLLSVTSVVSRWKSLSLLRIFSIVIILFTLATSISSILEKHKQTENPRPKILRDILILIVTFLLIIFLGGLAGIFAYYYASLRFGVAAGFVAAMAASFAVGYFVKKGVGKVFGG